MGAQKAELVRYVKCVSGARTPGGFRIARESGEVLGRTPPYHPELQPIGPILPHLRWNYPMRYDGSKVLPFLDSPPRDLPAKEFIARLAHSDRIAARADGAHEAPIIDDDMAPRLIVKSPARRAEL